MKHYYGTVDIGMVHANSYEEALEKFSGHVRDLPDMLATVDWHALVSIQEEDMCVDEDGCDAY